MANIVAVKRQRMTFCTYRDLLDKFREQSIKMNISMSRRIENFIISELEKEKQNENK